MSVILMCIVIKWLYYTFFRERGKHIVTKHVFCLYMLLKVAPYGFVQLQPDF